MATEIDEQRAVTVIQLAHKVLHLEERLSAYQVLYEEEIGQIRRSLHDCRRMLLLRLSAETGLSSNMPEVAESVPDPIEQTSPTEGWLCDT